MATSEAGGSETTIEIKIKTLDSQTYTLRVDKQMSVPALKAQIASVTGVLSEEQRLICRGKVLKDDQLLSAYHVEDGHTLHLVVRQPVPPSSGAPVFDPTDSSTSPSHSNDAAPRVVIETFCMPVQGDGMPPEISRIVSAVLNSIGLPEIVNGIDGLDVREHGIADSSAHQPEESGTRGPSDRSHGSIGHQTSVPLGSQPPPVLPDSLTTLSQYVTQIRNEFDVIDTGGRNSPMDESGGRNSSTTSSSGSRQQGLPTPGSLAEVLLSTRQMLVQEVGGSLLQLAAQLENQVNVTDAAARLSTQSNAMRTGVLLHSLGAFFLELGRTVMTLRMGQTPSEAVVNAGPAVFISQSGPNPIMVQPLPFQLGSSLGTIPMGAMQPATAVQGLGTGFMPRRIDIQIRRGSATATDASRDELRGVQQVPGQREPRSSADGETHVNQVSARVPEGPSLGGQSGVRVVPIRTMVATVPAPFSRLSTNSSGNSVGVFYHPVQGRFSQPSLGIASGEEGSQVSGERHPTDPQTDVSSMQQQNIEEPARDGQQGQANTRTINLNIMSSGGAQSNLESQRQIPSSVVQFLSTLFPGGEIHMEEASVQGTTTTSSPSEHATTSSAVPDSQEAEPPRVTDEGIFFSNVLRQIMPHISQQVQTGPDAIALDSSLQDGKSDAGTSRHQSENESDAPSSKRQKME